MMIVYGLNFQHPQKPTFPNDIYGFKGVVRLKIPVDMLNYTTQPRRDIAFYGQKLTENYRVKHAIFSCFEKQYPGKIRCLNTNPESLTVDISLPRIKMYIISVTTIKTMKRLHLL